MNEEYLGSELSAFVKSIKDLVTLPDEALTAENRKLIQENVEMNFTPELKEQSINQIVQNMDAQRLNKEEAKAAITSLLATLDEMVYDENFTTERKEFVDALMAPMHDIFTQALERFHSYSIVLPMVVDTAGGAKVPTYAHETDAAADLYAMEDTTLAANSKGNKIRTGVKIQLPEGWLALIIPRSSIGAKTPLRLSNSVGLIDSGYRGELGVLYDNLAAMPYEIHAGDRIAQLLVMPSYRFQAKVVDILTDSDRGEGGFGSSGN